MKMEPDNREPHINSEQEEYRRRTELKAKRRRKRRNQKLMLLGAFVLAAVLLVVCVVMVIRAIANPKDKTKPVSLDVSTSLSTPVEPTPAPVTPVAVDPTIWELMLINQSQPMPDGYMPETVSVSSSGHQFDKRASQSLLDMIAACNTQTQGSLAIASASRGQNTQTDKYNALVTLFKAAGDDAATADMKAREIDPPYPLSDHQTSLSVDFITSTVTEPAQAFSGTAEYTWLIANAAEYGFILRFPENKASITGITYQPYHFRYVGVEDAKIIAGAGICLEEYVVQLPATPPASVVDTSTASGASSVSAGSASSKKS